MYCTIWIFRLTAFVAKVFCHANSVVDGLLDETTDLYPTITYLKNRINEAGQFKEIHDIYSGFPLKVSKDFLLSVDIILLLEFVFFFPIVYTLLVKNWMGL